MSGETRDLPGFLVINSTWYNCNDNRRTGYDVDGGFRLENYLRERFRYRAKWEYVVVQPRRRHPVYSVHAVRWVNGAPKRLSNGLLRYLSLYFYFTQTARVSQISCFCSAPPVFDSSIRVLLFMPHFPSVVLPIRTTLLSPEKWIVDSRSSIHDHRDHSLGQKF